MEEKYPKIIVEEMYTDSISDFPMIERSKKGFMVKKNKIISYSDYKETKIEKIKHTFFTPKFIRFVFVGCLNTFNGVLFSFLYSLNSYITFHDKNLTLEKFIKFCISYIPNFIIQLICVFIIIDILHLYKLIAYILAAIIGIPITYLALLLFPFKEKKE